MGARSDIAGKGRYIKREESQEIEDENKIVLHRNLQAKLSKRRPTTPDAMELIWTLKIAKGECDVLGQNGKIKSGKNLNHSF